MKFWHFINKVFKKATIVALIPLMNTTPENPVV